MNKALSHWHDKSKFSTLDGNTCRHLELQNPWQLFLQTEKFRRKQFERKSNIISLCRIKILVYVFPQVQSDMNGNLEITQLIRLFDDSLLKLAFPITITHSHQGLRKSKELSFTSSYLGLLICKMGPTGPTS